MTNISIRLCKTIVAMFLLFVTILLACTDPSPAENPLSLQDLPPLPSPASAEPPRAAVRDTPVELRIALVGEVRGEIEPCGCPTLPYGGFVRRQRLLDELRAADGGPLFHLDAGETLLKGFSSAREDQDTRAAAILELSRSVGVDVWAPGPSDLATIGLDGVRLAGLPVTSATWRDAQGAPIFPLHQVVERAGVRLGVIGLSAAPSDPALRSQVQSLDPVEAARSALAALAPDAVDLVVALGSITDAEALRVAQGVPGLAAVLTTQGAAYSAPTAAPGAALRIEAPDRGRYIELVHVRVGAAVAGAPLVLLPDAQDWRSWLTLQAQVRQQPDPARRDALATLEAARAALGAGRNLAHVESVPLSEAYDDDDRADAVSGQVEGFKAAALAQAAQRAAQETTPLEPGYAAAGTCVNCHTQEMARWTFTDHARAWESLVQRKATGNPECVGCHTTGFGEVGGFGELSPAKLRKYKAVQCESCHGPLRGHPGAAEIQARPITPAGCVVCHDAANSPDFDFAADLPRASCQPTPHEGATAGEP